MPTWPSVLPRPLNDGYALKPIDPVQRTQFEAGNSRARRRTAAAPTIIPIQWKFTLAQMNIFESWHELDIASGASWFDIDLANGEGVSSYSARFETMWEATPLPGLNWLVKASLRVRVRPIMTAGELAAALGA